MDVPTQAARRDSDSVRLWQVMKQQEVLPADKAAARALGLCMKLKSEGDHGTYVRFKGKKLREHDVQHHETTAAKVRSRCASPDTLAH